MIDARSHLRQILTLAVAVVACSAATVVWADPVGSAVRVDQLVTIRIAQQRIGIEYAVTLNRPGAFQEFLTIDADGDGECSTNEQKTYFDEVGRDVMAGLEITVDGRELPLRQAGEMKLVMPFTKIFRFEADQSEGWQGGVDFEFHNDNYLAHEGDIAVRVQTAEGVHLGFAAHPPAGRGLGIAKDAAVPPPSFAPRRQRNVVLRYCGRGQLDGRPAAVTAVESLPNRNHQAGEFSPVRFETALLGAGIAAWVGLAISMVAAQCRGVRGQSRRTAALVVASLVVLCAAWSVCEAIANTPGDGAEPLSDDEAIAIFRSLHEGLYGAFRAETESDLYDALAASLDGALLSHTYLQVSRLTMRDDRQNGFFVRRVKPLDSERIPAGTATPSSFRVRHHWRVYGVVEHSGHRHARVNQYEATFSVDKQAGGWRITSAALRGCQRANPNLLFASTPP